MGFIHDTNFEILGFEGRNESVILSDRNTGCLYLPTISKERVQKEIAEEMMAKAGECYAHRRFDEAEKHKEKADAVLGTQLEPSYKPYSFEVHKKWLAALIKFLDKEENDQIKADILSFAPEEAEAENSQ